MRLQLSAGSLTVSLVPALGGSVASFRIGEIDLMRPLSAEKESCGDVSEVSMFPMLPWANRIAGNQFEFGGRVWSFTANSPPDPLSLHGSGWQSAWTVAHANPTEALLLLERIAPEEPYSYTASQHFTLTPDRLTVTMEVINRGPVAMPFGFGQHPWFPADPDTVIAFTASEFWSEGPDYLPVEPTLTPPDRDFSQGRTLPRVWINNNYGEWEGRAQIEFPSRKCGLRMHADPVFRNLMFYVDPAKQFFCLEPQTHVSGAFNRAQQSAGAAMGVLILQPASGAHGSIVFTPCTP